MALKVLRLHDDLSRLVEAEHSAANGYIEKKTTEALAKELKEESNALSEG